MEPTLRPHNNIISISFHYITAGYRRPFLLKSDFLMRRSTVDRAFLQLHNNWNLFTYIRSNVLTITMNRFRCIEILLLLLVAVATSAIRETVSCDFCVFAFSCLIVLLGFSARLVASFVEKYGVLFYASTNFQKNPSNFFSKLIAISKKRLTLLYNTQTTVVQLVQYMIDSNYSIYSIR